MTVISLRMRIWTADSRLRDDESGESLCPPHRYSRREEQQMISCPQQTQDRVEDVEKKYVLTKRSTHSSKNLGCVLMCTSISTPDKRRLLTPVDRI